MQNVELLCRVVVIGGILRAEVDMGVCYLYSADGVRVSKKVDIANIEQECQQKCCCRNVAICPKKLSHLQWQR